MGGAEFLADTALQNGQRRERNDTSWTASSAWFDVAIATHAAGVVMMRQGRN